MRTSMQDDSRKNPKVRACLARAVLCLKGDELFCSAALWGRLELCKCTNAGIL